MSPYDTALRKAAKALHDSLPGSVGTWDQMKPEMQERYITRARITVNAFNDAMKEQNS